MTKKKRRLDTNFRCFREFYIRSAGDRKNTYSLCFGNFIVPIDKMR